MKEGIEVTRKAYKAIAVRKKHGIVTLTMNRPEKLNAINARMEEEFAAALDEIAADREARVFILTGAGRAFCVGGDIIETAGTSRFGATVAEIASSLRETYFRTTLALRNLPLPTIAMVNGIASGWGFDLVLACDLKIASESARFNSAFVKVGLTPATGGVWLMPRSMGMSKAAELIFTGDFISAEEAGKLGILNKIVPDQDLEGETMNLAVRLSDAPPLALKLAKLQLIKGLTNDFKGALEAAADYQAVCLASEDFKEGVLSFQEKRSGKFKGR